MEQTNLKKLLDEALLKPYGDADDKLGSYMREEASNEDLRYIVQEVERTIKKLVDRGGGNSTWLFRHFSESEIDLLDYYFSTRDFALDLLMRNPTETEIERLGYMNDKLYRLSRECFEQCRNLSRTLRETPYKVDDHDLYSVRGMLHYEYSDETSVVAMPNDDYYGSDFQYMIRLKETLVGLEPAECSSIAPPCTDEMAEDESYAEKCWNDFDDGVSWAEGHLHNPAYAKFCICYALHALHTHSRDYCLPDILRMDNFKVLVRLQYDREECDSPEDYSDDFDTDCPKGLSGEELESYGKICQKMKEYDKKRENSSRYGKKTGNEIQRLLRADRDYDYGFMLMLERKKLQLMADYFSQADITYSDASKAKDMSLCVRLLDIILDEEKQIIEWTAEAVEHNGIRFQKSADGMTFNAELVYNGLMPDFPKYVNLRNALRFVSLSEHPKGPFLSAEEQKTRTEYFKKGVRKAKAWHLYNLVREYKMLGWWN